MAITKERKKEIVAQYETWISQSKAVFLTDYIGLSTKEMEDLRRGAREAGGEFHVVKNTLSKIAFQSSGYSVPDDLFDGTTAIGFAFDDAPGMAKALKDYASSSEFVKIKCGFMGGNFISAKDVIALAELPPLPALRAMLLGTLMAPANKLARVMAEPARQIAQVVKAYADQEAGS